MSTHPLGRRAGRGGRCCAGADRPAAATTPRRPRPSEDTAVLAGAAPVRGPPAPGVDDPDLDAALSEPVEDTRLPRRRRPGRSTRCTTTSTSPGTPRTGRSTARRQLIVPLDRRRRPRPARPRPSRSRCRRSTVDGEEAEFEHTRQGPRRQRRLRRGRPALRAVGRLLRHARAGRGADHPRATSAPPAARSPTDGAAWTMQEPFGAYTWYAVNDQPSDKALYDFTLARARRRGSGVANGELTEPRGGGRPDRHRVAPRRAASSYLVTVAFGDYTLTPDTTSASGVPITYWVPSDEPDQSRRPAASTPPEALDWVEEKLGPYPFVVARLPARRLQQRHGDPDDDHAGRHRLHDGRGRCSSTRSCTSGTATRSRPTTGATSG